MMEPGHTAWACGKSRRRIGTVVGKYLGVRLGNERRGPWR
jgi:hypothetical protein